MSPTYKLTYFDIRGLAEFTRLILAQAGVEYKDVRISREKWEELKPKTPFKQLPILEVDGVEIAQSRAIARLVAREHGLTGKNNIEAAQCDMIVDSWHDSFTPLTRWINESDPEKKVQILKEYVADTLTPHLNNILRILDRNGTGYLVGDSITWADIVTAHAVWNMLRLSPHALDDHPALKEHSEKILGLPNIKAWIAKRPVTEH